MTSTNYLDDEEWTRAVRRFFREREKAAKWAAIERQEKELRKLGPMGRVRKKRQLALHASLLRSVSSSKAAMRVGE